MIYHSRSYNLIPGLKICFMFIHLEAYVTFTTKPDDPSYVRNGSTAKLVWDYSDPNGDLTGIVFSVDVGGTFFTMFAQQNGIVSYSNSMPDAYKRRVRMEGRATLVIENITSQDKTKFKCKLFPGDESIVELILMGMYSLVSYKVYACTVML